ncbi:hypothetical protein Pla123a_24150 [Posidoniimonas polymericola]|uniref:Uncharacterized protein n=1 Tax=Posidoniimonas polymericola TaxID=2528002 RepID=A0A5C5YQF7_9BACT|nr:hypothetical protein Pla123a_24150 [Posidoniimonas polymericola]
MVTAVWKVVGKGKAASWTSLLRVLWCHVIDTTGPAWALGGSKYRLRSGKPKYTPENAHL